MNTSVPLVSVIIPSYNSADFIAQAIESVFQQTYPNIEIIVIDDGSTDDTQAVLRSYVNCITVEKKIRGGLSSARNRGITLAKGEYIAWLDADDVCHPERIAVQAAYLSANSDVDLVCSGFSAFNENGPISESFAAEYYAPLHSPQALQTLFPEHDLLTDGTTPWLRGMCTKSYDVYWGNIWEHLIWGNFIHPPTIMVRKKTCERAGVLKDNLTIAGDWEYFLRIAKTADFAYVDTPLLNYRLHAEQMSGGQNLQQNALSILTVFQATLEQNPELSEKYRKRTKHYLARCYFRIASAFAESEPRFAGRYLLKSFLLHPTDFRLAVCLVKMTVPKPVLALLSALKVLLIDFVAHI